MFHKALLVLLLLITQLIVPHAFALDLFDVDDSFFEENLNQNIKPLEVTGDSIKWDIFAKTKEKTTCVKDSEGFDDCVTTPIYSANIKALENKQVTITGFMFPLDPSEKQKNFLIGPYPASCPFNYHVGASQIVEVKLKKGIAFSYDPVTVKGTLSLQYNKETGIFYYLTQ